MTATGGKLPFFPLRALLEFDPGYKLYVARCLETGSVVTADDAETVREMLKELLEDEIEFAVEHENFANLFSSPASPDVWVKWNNIAAKNNIETMYISVNAKELRLDEREVSSEVQVVSITQ